jgi:hypothetical protein
MSVRQRQEVQELLSDSIFRAEGPIAASSRPERREPTAIPARSTKDVSGSTPPFEGQPSIAKS